jgi:hypothetical protein
MMHSFDFPGKLVLDRYNVEGKIQNNLYIDELIHHELFELKNRELILFVEARRVESKWIFNFADNDESKVYKFVQFG